MSHESALQPFSINFLSKRPKIGGDERVAVCLDVTAVLHLSALCLTGSRGEVLKGWGALLLPDQRSHGALISALMWPYNVLSLNLREIIIAWFRRSGGRTRLLHDGWTRASQLFTSETKTLKICQSSQTSAKPHTTTSNAETLCSISLSTCPFEPSWGLKFAFDAGRKLISAPFEEPIFRTHLISRTTWWNFPLS